MPTIEQNKLTWDERYQWSQGGDEWSVRWGGTDMEWYGTVLPRIHTFVPAKTILEIAPGFGRWTQFLKDLCDNLILVDLSEKCIQACRDRFASCPHVSYFVNDGKSLEMVADDSVDFVFSFDSLVHAEEDVIGAYVAQLAQKLKSDGVGFIHHSNLGQYVRYFSFISKLPESKKILLRKWGLVEKDHGRGPSMTAAKFRIHAERSGLQCMSQEILNWGTRHRLIDCFSVFCKRDSIWSRENRFLRNSDFMRGVRFIQKLSSLYGQQLPRQRD